MDITLELFTIFFNKTRIENKVKTENLAHNMYENVFSIVYIHKECYIPDDFSVKNDLAQTNLNQRT